MKYMQLWEEKILIKQEGLAAGEKRFLVSLIKKKLDKKYSAE